MLPTARELSEHADKSQFDVVSGYSIERSDRFGWIVSAIGLLATFPTGDDRELSIEAAMKMLADCKTPREAYEAVASRFDLPVAFVAGIGRGFDEDLCIDRAEIPYLDWLPDTQNDRHFYEIGVKTGFDVRKDHYVL